MAGLRSLQLSAFSLSSPTFASSTLSPTKYVRPLISADASGLRSVIPCNSNGGSSIRQVYRQPWQAALLKKGTALLLAPGLLSITGREGQSSIMNLPTAFDNSAGIGPVALSGSLFELIGLCISAFAAFVFLAYLLGCYFQEFRRALRVRHRKRLARLKFSPRGADRESIIEGCRCRRESAMAEVAGVLPDLDWRGLHFFMKSHDRVTLVWDTGRVNDGAPPTLYLGPEIPEEGTITGDGEVTIR
jgi:hypothetical protein